jgi:uncharacterized membrane protein
MDFTKALDKSEEGYEALSWVLYFGTIATGIVGLMPPLAFLCFVLYIAIMVLAYIRKTDAAGTLYASHLQNTFTVGIVSFVVSVILILFTIGTLGFGAILAIPLWLVLLVWSLYRIITGMLALKEKKPFTSLV